MEVIFWVIVFYWLYIGFFLKFKIILGEKKKRSLYEISVYSIDIVGNEINEVFIVLFMC